MSGENEDGMRITRKRMRDKPSCYPQIEVDVPGDRDGKRNDGNNPDLGRFKRLERVMFAISVV